MYPELDKSITKWLKSQQTPMKIATISDIEAYDDFIRYTGLNTSKNVFTRHFRSFGFERKSKRLPNSMDSVSKVYVYRKIKPCPNCPLTCGACGSVGFVVCATCDNTGYVRS